MEEEFKERFGATTLCHEGRGELDDMHLGARKCARYSFFRADQLRASAEVTLPPPTTPDASPGEISISIDCHA